MPDPNYRFEHLKFNCSNIGCNSRWMARPGYVTRSKSSKSESLMEQD